MEAWPPFCEDVLGQRIVRAHGLLRTGSVSRLDARRVVSDIPLAELASVVRSQMEPL